MFIVKYGSFRYRMLLRTCSNFRRFKISPVSSISVRNLTQSEASVALRPFYFAVHPDRFAKDPVIQSQNEKSLQVVDESSHEFSIVLYLDF